jgi:DNA-directed RNA polymerase specialized sigma24 family protein
MTGNEADDEEPRDFLTLDELLEAVRTLGRPELGKLRVAAAALSRGTGLDVDEVVSDAIDSAFTTRECPRDVPIMAFLVQTIRSRVNNHRKKAKRSTAKIYTVAGRRDDNWEPEVVDSSQNAEMGLIEREAEAERALDTEIVRKIAEALKDDYDAQLCLEGWAEGMKGQALRDLIGVDQRKLDYIAKKIRRVAWRLFPAGWRP